MNSAQIAKSQNAGVSVHPAYTGGAGEKTPVTLRNGPLETRKCTDVFWLLVFLIIWTISIIITCNVLKTGDPSALAAVYDPDGNKCGISPGYENYSYIYFVAPSSDSMNLTVCVSSCPEGNETALDCHPNSVVSSCEGNPNYQDYDNGTWIYPSYSVFDAFCLPANASQFPELVNYTQNSDLFGDKLSDLKNTWMIITASAFIALILGFLYVNFLKHFVGGLTYIMIFGLLLSTLLLGVFLLYRSTHVQEQAQDETFSFGQVHLQYNDPQTLQIAGGIMLGLFLILLLLIWWLWSRIRLAVAILRASAEFLEETPSSLVVAPLMFIVTFGYFAYWIWTTMYIYSSGEIAPQDHGYPFAQFELEGNLKYAFYFHLATLFLNTLILIAIPELIIASSACIWYFSGSTAKDPVSTSAWRTFRYHFGSLVIGSFVIAITAPLRIILREISVKQGNQSQNFIVSCCRCCINCYDRFIGFLTKHAYIQLAITSENFFPSAWDSGMLITRNAARFNVLGGIGQLFSFLGELFISFTTTFCCYSIITHSEYYQQRLHSPFMPGFCFILVSYAIASNFMNVYGLAADTLVHCYCMDEEMNVSAAQSKKTLKDFMKLHVSDREGLLAGHQNSSSHV